MPRRRSRRVIGYGNFHPSVAADIPGLMELAERRGVPLAARTARPADADEDRAGAGVPRPRAACGGWFSTNILGNRDGQALEDRTA
jgi:myo-inositol-1-phosphate synthase